MPKEGDLRVWWKPQVPMTSFLVPISSIEEGVKLMNVLADYDAFQLMHNVKPDYCNAGGIIIYRDGEWEDWESEDGDGDPAEWLRHNDPPAFVRATSLLTLLQLHEEP